MKIKPIIPILILLAVFLSCSKDNGVEPEIIKSAIQGVITLTGAWPATPEAVRVVSSKTFPFESADDLAFGPTVPNGADSYTYSYALRPGEYKLLGVAWREQGGGWEVASVCGLYFEGGDSLNPGAVVIPTDTSKVKGIDLVVNRSRARRMSTSEITGTVNFYGAWPDSFASAVVMASLKDPLAGSFSVLDMNTSTPITRDTQEAEYTIPAAAGLYRSLAVIFFQQDAPLTLDDLYYAQNIGGLVVQDLNVGDSQTVDGPDFDLEIGPINSAITGMIRFSGAWPEPAEEVRIVASDEFPPTLE